MVSRALFRTRIVHGLLHTVLLDCIRIPLGAKECSPDQTLEYPLLNNEHKRSIQFIQKWALFTDLIDASDVGLLTEGGKDFLLAVAMLDFSF
jgi:hypothetical protein